MGTAASIESNIDLGSIDYRYQKERSELRKALTNNFLNNPENKDIVSKIRAVKALITQNKEICATAAREATNEFDYSPINMDSALNELERLITIYEIGSILKSAQCRIGPVSCPLGHYSPYFDDPSLLKTGNDVILCSICNKSIKSGYHCSYCLYNLCPTCSKIYCCDGHEMVLWTHPESQHKCVVCDKKPVTSGYKCLICPDYDICDNCTYKEGRKAIQKIILDRMEGYLNFMEVHMKESETAKKTIENHNKKMESEFSYNTLELYQFSLKIKELRDISVEEVRLTRITKEVNRLRSIITQGKKYSVTATRESKREGHFTMDEIDRLKSLVKETNRLKSSEIRLSSKVTCPLGHGMQHTKGKPLQYLKRMGALMNNEKSFALYCKICERIAAPDIFHCDFCEYHLCLTCSDIYCSMGHLMSNWMIPEAHESCSLCQKEIFSGYRCSVCEENICDNCTAIEGRDKIRAIWEEEMKNHLNFMKENKRLSDIALYYNWRHSNFIVSIGLLCEYVKELRTARKLAEKQIEYKPIIDKIKKLRTEVCQNADISGTVVKEASKRQDYIFPTKKRALKELNRLTSILEDRLKAQSIENRMKRGIACPLGHGMEKIEQSDLDKTDVYYDKKKMEFTDKEFSNLFEAEEINKIEYMTAESVENLVFADKMRSQPFPPYKETENVLLNPPNRICKVCASEDLLEGNTCKLCEYDLCKDCSTLYCRLGHPLKIWTLPEAFNLSCDMCKKVNITSGYRCLQCSIDICDMCTTKDARNAFMLWPRRELKKKKEVLEELSQNSKIAHKYLIEFNSSDQKYFESMSKLCKKLNDLDDIIKESNNEIESKKKETMAKNFGISAKDF